MSRLTSKDGIFHRQAAFQGVVNQVDEGSASHSSTEERPPATEERPPALEMVRVLILVGSAFLLTSIGGVAAMAAPISLPLLWWCAYTTPFTVTRVFVLLVAGITGLETGWIVAYITLGKSFATPAAYAATVLVIAIIGITTFPKRVRKKSQTFET